MWIGLLQIQPRMWDRGFDDWSFQVEFRVETSIGTVPEQRHSGCRCTFVSYLLPVQPTGV